MNVNTQDRPVARIFEDIVSNIQEIVRSEIRLGKTELKTEVAKAARGGGILAGGAALAFYAVGFVLLAAVYALELVLAGWLAALIVGLLAGIVATVLITAGRTRLRRVNPPQKTIDTMRENIQWAREQTR